MSKKTPSHAATQPSRASDPAPAAILAVTPSSTEQIVTKYGDLLYDLCESILWSPANAQLAFRAVLKDARKKKSHTNAFELHERASILRGACDVLRPFAARYGRRLAPSEQIMLDGMLSPEQRLKQLDSYFHRLATDDQLLLLLHDKHQLPYPEISTALGIPQATLQLRRRQALRTLEEWIWNET